MTNPADSESHSEWEFDYFYDEIFGAELYRHGDGQGDEICQGAVDEAKECWVLNAADGKAYVRGIEAGTCCKYPMHLGMIKSDWLINSNAR